MTPDELQTTLASLRNEIMKSHGEKAKGGTVVNSGKIRQARITIARILTVMRKRNIITRPQS
jgi:ribosomal protein L29